MDKIKEGIIDNLFGDKDGSGLANPDSQNPEEVKKELDDEVKKTLGSDNVDVSKCSAEELLAMLGRTKTLDEAIDIIKDNFDEYDESVISKVLMDRYGFLDDEATNIYESIKSDKDRFKIDIDKLYDELDEAVEKGFIPDKYCYDQCIDDEFIPVSLEDCIEHCKKEKIDGQ